MRNRSTALRSRCCSAIGCRAAPRPGSSFYKRHGADKRKRKRCSSDGSRAEIRPGSSFCDRHGVPSRNARLCSLWDRLDRESAEQTEQCSGGSAPRDQASHVVVCGTVYKESLRSRQCCSRHCKECTVQRRQWSQRSRQKRKAL